MKYRILFVLSIAALIVCCQRGRDSANAVQSVTAIEIKATLAALSDSVRTHGFPGWIGFLENSKDFQWSALGTTMPYDSLVARFRKGADDFHSFTISWDSVRVEPANKDEAKLFAVWTERAADESGQNIVVTFDMSADLRKVEGSWKFHACTISGHTQVDTTNDVAVADTSQLLREKIGRVVKASMGQNYSIGDVLDVDDRTTNASERIYQMMGVLFEDPHRQLEHSYIVTVYSCNDKGEWVYDSGAVAIVRDDKLAWHSRFLVRDMGSAALPGFGDLNNDGTTDILVTTPADMRGYSEELWIISPDSSGGRLLNAVDELGESVIIGASNTFKFSRSRPTGAMMIKANEVGEDLNRYLVYTWNGSVFTKAKSKK